MPQTQFGPTNIQQGNTAFFTAEFYDANGNTTVPSGATLTITYINLSNASQTDIVTMSLENYFYICTWSSAFASRGLATYVIAATAGSTATNTGQIRVIDP